VNSGTPLIFNCKYILFTKLFIESGITIPIFPIFFPFLFRFPPNSGKFSKDVNCVPAPAGFLYFFASASAFDFASASAFDFASASAFSAAMRSASAFSAAMRSGSLRTASVFSSAKRFSSAAPCAC
jgi:hypothetical protein